jgi:hypothetical protein
MPSVVTRLSRWLCLLALAAALAAGQPRPPVAGRLDALPSGDDYIKYVDARSGDELFPVNINNWWGHMNQRGRLVVYPRFDWTDRSYENLARAVQEGRTGFIDKTGKWRIEPRFAYADRFSQGYAVVGDGDKFSFINKRGDLLMPLELDGALRFREGMAAVRAGKRCGFINKAGDVAVEPRFAQVRSFHEGLAAVRTIEDGEASRWGYIDKGGAFQFLDDREQRVQHFGDFHEKLARVEVDGEWGYISRGFTVRIEPRFQAARDFHRGVAAVKQEGAWGFINKKGDWVAEPQFEAADDFGDDSGEKTHALVKRRLAFGYVNRRGDISIEPQFEDARPFFRSRARVSREPSFGYIDTSGGVIWDSQHADNGLVDMTAFGQVAARADKDRPGARLLKLPPERPARPAPYPPEHQYQEVLPKFD